MPELTTTFLDLICPYCKETLDASTYAGLAEHRPTVGSLSVCAECSEVSIYVKCPKGLALEPFDVGKLKPAEQAKIRGLQRFTKERHHRKN